MGSIITVSKHAAAFRAADGLVYFALYEKTYESNVSPKTPRWSCIHFGTLDSAIRRIFDFGGSCEGGMLCGPARRPILPETYIGHWLRLMKAPHAMPDRRVILRTGDGFANAFSGETCARGADVFNQAGFGFIADEVAQGKAVSSDLHAYAGPLARLWADKIVHPWRIIQDGPCLDSTTAPSLGYNSTPARAFTVRPVEAYKADENNILMRDARRQLADRRLGLFDRGRLREEPRRRGAEFCLALTARGSKRSARPSKPRPLCRPGRPSRSSPAIGRGGAATTSGR